MTITHTLLFLFLSGGPPPHTHRHSNSNSPTGSRLSPDPWILVPSWGRAAFTMFDVLSVLIQTRCSLLRPQLAGASRGPAAPLSLFFWEVCSLHSQNMLWGSDSALVESPAHHRCCSLTLGGVQLLQDFLCIYVVALMWPHGGNDSRGDVVRLCQ